MTSYVVGFAFTPTEDAVALILKNRPEWQRGLLNGIGGHIEDGESAPNAMSREFEEESGGNAEWELFAKLTGPAFDGGGEFELFCFRGTTDDDLEAMSDEGPIIWCDPVNLPANVLRNLRWLVPLSRIEQRGQWPMLIQERGA